MSVSIQSSNDSKLQFPKLMRNGMHTILFASPTEGMVMEVLGKDAPYNVGSMQINISATDYHDYNGTVKINNGK